MQTFLRNTLRMTVVLLLVVALFGAGLIQASAASLPPTSACTGAGTGAVTCNLWAKSGSFTPPGGVLTTIWGYTDSAGGTLSAPGGPVLIANQGDVVTVNLTNNLTETTSVFFQGQNLIPDTAGVGAGGSASYVFTASAPGTYLYEAGLAPNSQHQVAMGLYGALVVRPSTAGQAYADASTAFTEETLVVLSELDTLLNNNATPSTFDMRNFKPKYFLINGKAYPNTDPIPVAAGGTLLLRYVNAGLQSHSMTLLGFSQKVIATDGKAYGHAYSAAAETIAPGQTLDTLVTVPATATNDSKFALYDSNMLLRNNTGVGASAGFGGMLTFLTVSNTPVIGGDSTGPVTSGLALTPNQVGATAVSVDIAASSTDSIGDVSSAEYFIDAPGADGAGIAMSGSFGSPTVAVSATISAVDIGALSTGNHTIYVHALDSNGHWGAFTSAILRIDETGPATTGLSLAPNPSTGSANVTLSGTGNDTANGGSNVTAAEYFIDPVGAPANGSGTAMTGSFASSTVAISAAIPAATISGLGAGPHIVAVHSQDAAGNWGALTNITLNLDLAGPTTTSVTAVPNPNNGTLPYNSSTQAVRISASFLDDIGTISAAEAFIGAVGANGTGFPFIANDGVFNSVGEGGYAHVPLTTIKGLPEGNNTISVHGRDAAGNWGPFTTATLTVDKTAPIASGLTLTPSASNNTAVSISAAANDTASNVTTGEFFIDAVGVAGSGTALTASPVAPSTTLTGTIPAATVAALTAGNHTVYVRAKDAAGNWGATISTVLIIDRTPPTFSGISISPTSINAGTASVTLTVNGAADTGGSGVAGGEYWFGTTNITPGTGTAFTGASGISVATGALTPGSYTLRVRIRDGAGNWSTGTNGVRTTTLTVTFASGPLYFSTLGNTNPPGVAGTADDADIYLYNGSVFSRSIDVTTITNPLPSSANVDGFDRVDATHFYMSFSNQVTITLPGPDLTVEDEDVVYYNAGTWSVFFDGSANGLTSANYDLDAISIVGGTFYFSTENTNVPIGAGGTGDDADIYIWNGGSSYTRVYDASVLGWSTANVDGFVRIDATHFYLSYSADTTVPVLGAVQDEDVVYYNNGTWSLYFDGTSLGLTDGNEDTDAFDLP